MNTTCPQCTSPAPHLHPAVQHEGEVTICRNAFHERETTENTPGLIAKVRAILEVEKGGSGG